MSSAARPDLRITRGYKLDFTLSHDTGKDNQLLNTHIQAMLQRDVAGRAAPVTCARAAQDSRDSRGLY